MTPISGMVSITRWMMAGAVVTMPEGIVKGPESCLPRNSVVTGVSPSWVRNYKVLDSGTSWLGKEI